MARKLSAALVVAMTVAAGTALAQESLTMGMVLEPPHLDPTAGAAAAIREVGYANIFEGLTRIDQTGAVQPALARTWTIADDGLTYVFEITPDAVFHNGVPLTAEHVVFSFERAMAEDSVNAQKQLFEPIARVEATADHTVTITLERPTGHFLFNLGWGDMVIVEPSSAETNRTSPSAPGPSASPAGSPAIGSSWSATPTTGARPRPLARATFKFIPDPAAATAAMLAGDVDAFANFPAPEALAQFENDPRFQVVIGSTEGETILAINNARPPLDDVRVRRALAHAVDRQAVIDGAMFGYGTPIGSHFAPHHPAYVDLTGRYPHDPEQARWRSSPRPGSTTSS
jgi:peptide/nickel transport system substrate-binding protein